jgi:hypothetical protein
MTKRSNSTPVREAIEAAADAPPLPEADEATRRRRSGSPGFLADDPPFCCLGINGDKCVILDNLNQLHQKTPRELSRNGIVQLCGRRPEWLFDNYGQRNEEGEIVRYKPDRVADAIMYSCAEKGIFSPAEMVRGAGAWLGDDGRLVLHCGDVVLIGGRQHTPGLLETYVYPAAAAIPKAWPTPVRGGVDGVGAGLLGLIKTWNWRHPRRDPRLAIGWIGASMVGGALDWRPAWWVTGDSGTGKSTLLKLIKGLFGRALIASGDASAAGIRQKLAFASLPVALDEIEAGQDDPQVQQILKLIRNASTGSTALRGGADHSGAEFTIRSCFLANSVLVPAMSRADRSRVAISELLEMPKGVVPPDLSPARLRDLGAKLLRRMIDGWHRWPATLEMYKAACARRGLNSRACDVVATLLAAADLLLEDAELHADFAEEVVDEVVVDAGDEDEGARDQDRCLQHLLTSPLPPDGPNRHSVGHWVAQAVDGIPAEQRQESFSTGGYGDGRKAANDLLGTYGMRIVTEDGQKCLAVANSHQGLARLFAGTHWLGRSGTSSIWRQTLMRLPGAQPSKKTVRFDGAATGRATLIPLPIVYQPDAPAWDGHEPNR